MAPTSLGADIKTYLAEEGIPQKVLAERADVSQATVSRALGQDPQRNSEARQRLMIFIREHAVARQGPAEAFAALEQIWDGTEAHAGALAELIRSSRGLWPSLAQRGGHDGG